MQNFACKENCLLRVILEKTMRRIQSNCELIADLSDLQHNEPGRLHEVVTKLQIINDVQKDARHLLSCLEKGCESNMSQTLMITSMTATLLMTAIPPSQTMKLMMTNKNSRLKLINAISPPILNIQTPAWSVAMARNLSPFQGGIKTGREKNHNEETRAKILGSYEPMTGALPFY